jgi:hypothetical protein
VTPQADPTSPALVQLLLHRFASTKLPAHRHLSESRRHFHSDGAYPHAGHAHITTPQREPALSCRTQAQGILSSFSPFFSCQWCGKGWPVESGWIPTTITAHSAIATATFCRPRRPGCLPFRVSLARVQDAASALESDALRLQESHSRQLTVLGLAS